MEGDSKPGGFAMTHRIPLEYDGCGANLAQLDRIVSWHPKPTPAPEEEPEENIRSESKPRRPMVGQLRVTGINDEFASCYTEPKR